MVYRVNMVYRANMVYRVNMVYRIVYRVKEYLCRRDKRIDCTKKINITTVKPY